MKWYGPFTYDEADLHVREAIKLGLAFEVRLYPERVWIQA